MAGTRWAGAEGLLEKHRGWGSTRRCWEQMPSGGFQAGGSYPAIPPGLEGCLCSGQQQGMGMPGGKIPGDKSRHWSWLCRSVSGG